jgi:hypothetical protein
MKFKHFAYTLAFSSVLSGFPCLAGDLMVPLLKVEQDPAMPSFDLLRMRYQSEGTRGFKSSNAQLDTTAYSIGGFLSKPINLGGDWRAIPFLNYSQTTLDFDQLSAGIPFSDKDLHKASLNALFFHQATGSPWTYGAWGRVSFSSDTRDINGDDFLYDLGIGAGYRVNDRLMVGLGFVGLEIGRDSLYLPGPLLMWKPTESLNFAIMGPLLITTWEVNDRWNLALRGGPNGGTWNVDENGDSNNYDLSSYAIRLHTEHRLKDNLWLSLGVGYSFAGDFEVRDSSDDQVFEDDLDGGLSLSVGLRLRAW